MFEICVARIGLQGEFSMSYILAVTPFKSIYLAHAIPFAVFFIWILIVIEKKERTHGLRLTQQCICFKE